MGCVEGAAKVRRKGKATIVDKDEMLPSEKRVDDIIVDWIANRTKWANRGKDDHSVNGEVRDHGDLMGILTIYTMVLLLGCNLASRKLRGLYKDFVSSKGDTQPIHRPAFGSKYFSIQQWIGFWREWLQIYHVRARRNTDQGLWAWATWVSGSSRCITGCWEAMMIPFRCVAQSGVLGEVESLIKWVVGMVQENLEGQDKLGGMIQIDPMNPPLRQTLRERLGESGRQQERRDNTQRRTVSQTWWRYRWCQHASRELYSRISERQSHQLSFQRLLQRLKIIEYLQSFAACQSSIEVIDGTLISSPLHHFTVCTINSNDMYHEKMKQLLQHMKDQDIDIMCLTDIRFLIKIAKS